MEFQKEDKHLQKAINDLPNFSPKDETWDEVLSVLDEEHRPKKGQGDFRLIAAVVLTVMVSAFVIWNLQDKEGSDIQFSEEISVSEDFSAEDLLEDMAFDDFIAAECAEVKEICEDESLIQLLDQLKVLRSEAVQMVELINNTGYDEYLMKAKSRLERENAQVKREIMALIRG